MAICKLYDLARMNTATTGTGTLTLTTAVAPFKTFAQAGVQNLDVIRYALYDPAAGGVEMGIGVYSSSGPTLTRVPNNGATPISLSGTAQVLITASANDIAGLMPLWTSTTFVVSPGGSNTTGNGSIAAPWQTVQYASDFIQKGIFRNGQQVVIQMADSTSYAGLVLTGPYQGPGTTILAGNSGTPTNTAIAGIQLRQGANLAVLNFQIKPAASGFAFDNGDQSFLSVLGGIDYATGASVHHANFANSTTERVGNLTVSASNAMNSHIQAANNSVVRDQGVALTFNASPTFGATGGYVKVSLCSSANISTTTYASAGSVAGPKFSISTGGSVLCGSSVGAGLPGNAAGVNNGGFIA